MHAYNWEKILRVWWNVDTTALEAVALTGVRVRVPLRALTALLPYRSEIGVLGVRSNGVYSLTRHLRASVRFLPSYILRLLSERKIKWTHAGSTPAGGALS